jgi:hypothetical protein
MSQQKAILGFLTIVYIFKVQLMHWSAELVGVLVLLMAVAKILTVKEPARLPCFGRLMDI